MSCKEVGTFCRTGSYNEIFKNHQIPHGTITVAEFHAFSQLWRKFQLVKKMQKFAFACCSIQAYEKVISLNCRICDPDP